MALEIERKFLVINDDWRRHVVQSERMVQGYLCYQNNTSLRVRIGAGRAHLNIKRGGLTISRQEYEYEIPLQDAEEMVRGITTLVEKTRHLVTCGDHLWEVDVFEGANRGLIVAEIELTSEDEAFQLPDWAGEEVSDQARYYNVNLIDHPFCQWAERG